MDEAYPRRKREKARWTHSLCIEDAQSIAPCCNRSWWNAHRTEACDSFSSACSRAPSTSLWSRERECKAHSWESLSNWREDSSRWERVMKGYMCLGVGSEELASILVQTIHQFFSGLRIESECSIPESGKKWETSPHKASILCSSLDSERIPPERMREWSWRCTGSRNRIEEDSEEWSTPSLVITSLD